MMQTELARVLDIGKVALGGLLDRLENNGYVARVADPADRRAKRVVMTDAGAKLLSQIQKRASALNDEMMRDISLEEIHLAEDILHRMKDRLLIMEGGQRDTASADDEESDEAPRKVAVGG